jgi:hypothetical protein
VMNKQSQSEDLSFLGSLWIWLLLIPGYPENESSAAEWC